MDVAIAGKQLFVFLVLVTSLIGCWLFSRTIAWGFFLAASLLGLVSGVLHIFGIIWLVLLGVFVAGYYGKFPAANRISHLVLGFILSFIGFFALKEMLPGFEDLQVFESENHLLDFHFETAALAFFYLAIGNFASSASFTKAHMKKTLFYAALTTVCILAVNLALRYEYVALEWPDLLPLWIVKNIFFITLPQECFFRGFLQKEISKHWQTKPYGCWIAAILFALLSFPNLYQVLISFIAGLCYGYIYQKMRAIEPVVVAHFFVNLTLYLLFPV